MSGIWHLASGIALALAAGLTAAAGEAPAQDKAAPDPLAVERAMGELRSGDWILQWRAMRRLADWRVADAAPAIREVLGRDKRPWLRGRALVALATLMGEGVFNEVAHFAKAGEPELRAAACQALGVIGADRAAPLLAERLADREPAVRQQALVALARVQRAAAWEAVVKHLGDEDPEMVRHGAQALGYVGTPEAAARLLELLGHDHAGVRADAALTLGRIRPREAIPPLLGRMAADPDTNVRAAARKALAAYAPDALAAPMLDALRGEDARLYESALTILALRPTRAAADAVARILRHADKRYVAILPLALDVLVGIDPNAYLDVFTGFLHHESRTVRTRAITAVARCPKANPFVLLRDSMTAEDSSARYATFRAMRAAKDKAPPEGFVAFLAAPLRHGDPKVVHSALALLRERIEREDLPRAVDLLIPLVGSEDREIRRDAVKVLDTFADDDARRRVARAQGYLTDWMVIGSFPNDRSNKGFDTAYPPEKEIDFAKRYESHVFGFAAAFEVRDVACGGERRRCFSIRPPYQGRVRTGSVIATFPLELPDRDGLRLTAFIGLADDADPKGDGVAFRFRIGGRTLLERAVEKPGPWEPVKVELGAFRGKQVALEAVVDGQRRARRDHAGIAEPRILAGNDVVTDLFTLADKARPRVAIPGRTDQLAWTPIRVARLDGTLELHDLMPSPIQYRTAYAVADVELPAETQARLWVAHDDGLKLWLNGQLILSHGSRGERHQDITLPAGRSRLLAKICNMTEWWRLSIRLTTPKGGALDGLKHGD